MVQKAQKYQPFGLLGEGGLNKLLKLEVTKG